MKTGELSKILGHDKGTIYNWADHPLMAKYLSESARGVNGTSQRLYSEADVLVLNTIRTLRAGGTNDWNAIAQTLETGFRVQEFPQNAISQDSRMIPMPQAAQAGELMAMKAERDMAFRQVEYFQAEIGRLRQELDRIQQQWRDDKADTTERLTREIGKLQAKIEAMERRLGN